MITQVKNKDKHTNMQSNKKTRLDLLMDSPAESPHESQKFENEWLRQKFGHPDGLQSRKISPGKS